MLFACTVRRTRRSPSERLPAGLRGITAGRAALQLTGELAGDEQLWQRALERWLTHGGQLVALAGQLEVALVHERSAPHFA